MNINFEDIFSTILSFVTSIGGMILTVIVTTAIGLAVTKLILSLLKQALQKSNLDPMCHKFTLSIAKFSLYILVIVTVCTIVGIPMSSIVAIIGAAGLAVGLALQDSLSNVAGGFILLISKPFSVGHTVEIGAIKGTVKHINMLQTKLLTVDNKAIYIPNGQVASATIVNYSNETNRRLDLVVSISYNDDFTKAQSIITNIINNHPNALKEPACVVRMAEHGDNAIKIAVKTWVENPDYWNLQYDLLEQIKSEFDQNNITIPYNQLDVRIIEQPK